VGAINQMNLQSLGANTPEGDATACAQALLKVDLANKGNSRVIRAVQAGQPGHGRLKLNDGDFAAHTNGINAWLAGE
jgi:hypothetical protein